MTSTSTTRIPCLDAVRAFSACSVVMLHAACGYLTYPIPQWPRYGGEFSILFDYITVTIHMFTMPIFFFLAGFFCFSLAAKIGNLAFLNNRLRKILLPLAVLTILFNLQLLLLKVFSHQIHTLTDVVSCFRNLRHLWFLEYVLIFYFGFMLLAFFKNSRILALVDSSLLRSLHSRCHPFLLITLLFSVLYCGGFWYMPVSLDMVPNIWLLIYCSIFFMLGFWVSKQHILFEIFSFKRYQIFLLFVIYAIYTWFLQVHGLTQSNRAVVLLSFVCGSYLLVNLVMSICIRYFNKPNVWLRSMSNASYCIYLTHILYIQLVHHYVAKFYSSMYLQFGIIFVTSLGLGYITYQIFYGNGTKLIRPLFAN